MIFFVMCEVPNKELKNISTRSNIKVFKIIALFNIMRYCFSYMMVSVVCEVPNKICSNLVSECYIKFCFVIYFCFSLTNKKISSAKVHPAPNISSHEEIRVSSC